MSEPRIYAIVARSVKPGNRSIIQSDGRMAAQASHAEASLRHASTSFPKDKPFRNLTTIILEARNQEELNHIAVLVNRDNFANTHVTERDSLEFWNYFDHNPEVYGTENQVLTSMAVYGKPEDLEYILGYIPLFPYKNNA